MKRPLTALCLLGLAAGSVLAAGTVSADGPDVTVGTPNPSGDRFDCSNDQCQYGFQDMAPGSGWTLGLGWQLGIQCGRDIITGVGFWSEFVVVPGPMDVVINGTTAGTFATESPGENYLEIMPPFEACGGACITLCPRGDTWLVTGEDYNSPPYGHSYWSHDCECTNPFPDNNVTIWACFAHCMIPARTLSWGQIRMLYR